MGQEQVFIISRIHWYKPAREVGGIRKTGRRNIIFRIGRLLVNVHTFGAVLFGICFDFGAAHRTEGDRPGINDKGLVTHDRKVKKDAFYFYKANWNPEPMVILPVTVA